MRFIPLAAVLVLLGCATPTHAANGQSEESSPASAPRVASTQAHDGAHDFDFLFGSWHIHNKRLSLDSHQWETFDATHTTIPVLGGLGNMDEFVPKNWRPGFIGLSLRLFDPAKKIWSIYWINNRTVTLEAPVVGRFDHGVGVFEADEEANGKPIRIRYKWSDITATSAHWELASSPDGGRTWETTWFMDFARTPLRLETTR